MKKKTNGGLKYRQNGDLEVRPIFTSVNNPTYLQFKKKTNCLCNLIYLYLRTFFLFTQDFILIRFSKFINFSPSLVFSYFILLQYFYIYFIHVCISPAGKKPILFSRLQKVKDLFTIIPLRILCVLFSSRLYD